MSSLIEINKFSYQYCRDNYEQLNDICTPLLNLGINYFAYIKIFKNGRFLNLFNNISALENWLFTGGGFGDLFVTFYEKSEPKSCMLTPFDEASLKKDRTISLLRHHQITSSFNISKRDNLGSITNYHFYSTSNDPLFSRFYFENISLLEHFTHYFEEKGQNLIDPTDENKFANFYQKINIPNNVEEKNILNNKIDRFLLETKLPYTTLKSKTGEIKLTKRENQCLYYLSQGQTFKEIAQSLCLSPRTIEFYFNRLKEKSGYKSREELIIQFNKGIIPPVN